MKNFERNDIEDLTRAYLPDDFPVAVILKQDSAATNADEILKKFPVLNPTHDRDLVDEFIKWPLPPEHPSPAGIFCMKINGSIIALLYVDIKNIGHTAFLDKSYSCPPTLNKPIAIYTIAHELGHLALSRETGAAQDISDSSLYRRNKKMLAALREKYGVDIKQGQFRQFEEAVSDLYGCVVANRETGADFRSLLGLISALRMVPFYPAMETMSQGGYPDPMILRYYVTPLLHQALAHFELPGPTVADKDIYAHCLRFMAETYKRMPELLDLPDYIPQPFPNIQLRDAAIAAGKLAPDELAAQSPLTRLMTHLVYGLHHLYGHGEKLPTRAGERNDDSIPGAPGLT